MKDTLTKELKENGTKRRKYIKKERTRKRKQKPRNHRIPLFQMPAIASYFPLGNLCYTSYLLTDLLPSLLPET
jgi:hypothetical protein